MYKINAQDYLRYLQDHQLVDEPKINKIKKYITDNAQQPRLPFYFHLLAGVGTFISTFCLYSILDLFGFISFRNAQGFLGWGISFIVFSILLYVQIKNCKNLVQQSFMLQFSFALILVGKFFILFYALLHLQNYLNIHSTWFYSGILLILTSATFFLYKIRVERFLGCFFLFLSIIYNISETPFFQAHTVFVLNFYILLQLILASVLFVHPRVKSTLTPIAYAFVLSIAVELVFYDFFALTDKNFSLAYAQYGFGLFLIWSIFWASGTRPIIASLKNIHLILASLAIILLSIFTAPGIIFSLYLIVFGYASQRRLLWQLGILLMPLYLFFYYYNLQVTLLEKSFIMFLSGLILLIGAVYIRFAKLDQSKVEV